MSFLRLIPVVSENNTLFFKEENSLTPQLTAGHFCSNDQRYEVEVLRNGAIVSTGYLAPYGTHEKEQYFFELSGILETQYTTTMSAKNFKEGDQVKVYKK